MSLPYGGKCPYDNTYIDATFGYYERWFCLNGHEWNRAEDIVVLDRCEGSFKYGERCDDFTSVCQWCGNRVEHYPFFNRTYGNLMKFHRLKQPKNVALELGEIFNFSEAKYFGIIATRCDGCNEGLNNSVSSQIATDRLGRRQYVVHLGCYTKLVEQLERRE